jgi:hypothetical protein
MREQLLELIWAAVTEEQREQSLLLGAEGIIEMVREEYDDGIWDEVGLLRLFRGLRKEMVEAMMTKGPKPKMVRWKAGGLMERR